MLIIRKELKVGLGIGAAVLGVAIVYGGMAALSGSSGKSDLSASNESGNTETIHVDMGSAPQTGLDSAVAGLPPVEGSPADKTTNDPWAESTRSDGSNNDDKWTVAWNTGRVDATPAFNNNRRTPEGPLVTTKLPDTETANPLASLGTPGSSANTGGISSNGSAPVRTPPSQTGSTPSAKYTIQPGDTFSSIAAKIYGNRNLYHVIEKANPSVNPGRLKIGQEINVPAKDAVRTERGSLDVTPTSAITGAIDASKQYRIQPGDTLHKISQKLYGKTGFWTSIYEVNKQAIGPNAGKLKVGMVLELPNVPSAP